MYSSSRKLLLLLSWAVLEPCAVFRKQSSPNTSPLSLVLCPIKLGFLWILLLTLGLKPLLSDQLRNGLHIREALFLYLPDKILISSDIFRDPFFLEHT